MSSLKRGARRAPALESGLPKVASTRAANGEANTVRLGPRDRVVGQLYVDGDLRVLGTVEGEVVASGDVEIDENAQVKASVDGREVSVRGQVTGPVTARRRLLLAGSGSVIGDVQVQRLVIQEGATFSGNVRMGKPGDGASKSVSSESRPRAPRRQGKRPH